MSALNEQARTQRPDFLVFSDDWGEHPSSCQHIFRYIAKDHRVLWVNTIGMRNPTFTLTDARKILRKVSKMIRMRRTSPAPACEPDEHVTVSQPMMLPGVRSRLVRTFNARSVTRTIREQLRTLQIDSPIVVTTVPNAAEYPDLLKDHKVVYYCVDDFSLWPGLESDFVCEMEARLIARADCIITVSETLYRRLKNSGKPTHLLTHGVDVEMFSTPGGREHSVLRDIAKPRAGFFGLIDGRMDWDLVVPLAREMPETSFVFAGPVDASAGELPQMENLHFVGPLRYAELPELIAGLNLLMLPYRTGLLAEALSPLKFKEYLASGKPVVSAAIAEARLWGAAVRVATTVEEWVSALNALMADPTSSVQVPSTLKDESWEHKASVFQRVCA